MFSFCVEEQMRTTLKAFAYHRLGTTGLNQQHSWKSKLILTWVSISPFFKPHRLLSTLLAFVKRRCLVPWGCCPPASNIPDTIVALYLFENRGNYPSFRLQAHAGAALVNFVEDCPKTVLVPYLDPLCSKLEHVLSTKIQEVIELVHSAFFLLCMFKVQPRSQHHEIFITKNCTGMK